MDGVDTSIGNRCVSSLVQNEGKRNYFELNVCNLDCRGSLNLLHAKPPTMMHMPKTLRAV